MARGRPLCVGGGGSRDHRHPASIRTGVAIRQWSRDRPGRAVRSRPGQGRAAPLLPRSAHLGLRDRGDRSRRGRGRGAGLLPPARSGRQPSGGVLPADHRAGEPVPLRGGVSGLPRIDSRTPSATGHRTAARHSALPPPSRRRGVQLQRGLGPLLRTAGRRDRPLLRRPRPVGHALPRRPAGLPAGRRHRPAPLRLVARAGGRLHVATHRDDPGQRGQRSRPLHRLAGSGRLLPDRQARDPAAPRAGPWRAR